MPYKLREFHCAGCGQLVTGRRPAGADVFCIECAVARSVANIVQLRAKRGEFYRHWAEGLQRAAAGAVQLAGPVGDTDSAG